MAVEIRELVIRAVVTNEGTNRDDVNLQPAYLNQQQLVQECVNQVLKIIKQSQNR